MSQEEAEELRRQFSEQIEGIDQNGIFLNNVRIALVMFIPAAGAGFGTFAGFSTGAVVGAFASSTPELAGINSLLIFILPHGIMEVFVYGMAISRSGLLIVGLAKDKPWRAGNGRPFLERSVVPTLIELGISAVVLFVGAVIEWQTIQWFGGLDNSTLLGA
jgi:uncharacterized membrane protein SpoIIM required for sporulation